MGVNLLFININNLLDMKRKLDMERQQRLKAAFEYLRGHGLVRSQKDFGERIGKREGTVSKALAGHAESLTDNILTAVYRVFNPIFNYDWLLTGKGSMIDHPLPDIVPQPRNSGISDKKSSSINNLPSDGKNAQISQSVPSGGVPSGSNAHPLLILNHPAQTNSNGIDSPRSASGGPESHPTDDGINGIGGKSDVMSGNEGIVGNNDKDADSIISGANVALDKGTSTTPSSSSELGFTKSDTKATLAAVAEMYTKAHSELSRVSAIRKDTEKANREVHALLSELQSSRSALDTARADILSTRNELQNAVVVMRQLVTRITDLIVRGDFDTMSIAAEPRSSSSTSDVPEKSNNQ